jgi:hypothetical protein
VEKFRRILTFEVVEGKKEAKYLEKLKEGVATSCRSRTSSTERDTLFSCAEVLKGRDRRSKFFIENL